MKKRSIALIGAAVALASIALVGTSANAAGEVGQYSGSKTCGGNQTLKLASVTVNDGGGPYLVFHATYSTYGGTRTSYVAWSTPGSHSTATTGQAKGNPWVIHTDYGHITSYSIPCVNIA